MALYLEIHTGELVGTIQQRHEAARQGPGTSAIRYLRYWVGATAREVFALVEAPSREAVEALHDSPDQGHLFELPGFVG